ncbi:MAG TPA: hypothetical protein VF624_01635, partial [Tepidisphaeraceae bacterium]
MRWIAVLLVALSLARTALAEAVTLDAPLYCEVFLKNTPARAGKVTGNLVSYDDEAFKVQNGSKEQTLAWSAVTPTSAFALRQRLIDKKSARDWLTLGTFGWKIGVADQARAALKSAVRLDPALKAEADAVVAGPGGELVRSDAPPADAKPRQAKEDDPVVAQPGRKKGEAAERVKYAPATPEEHAKAIERAKKQAARAEEALGVKFET